MNRMTRRILLVISLLVFLAIAPLVVLYAIGHRSSFLREHTAESVGVILLDTIPRRSNAVVNEREMGRTPRAVPNMLPGDARVRLWQEGYVPWEKTIEVRPTRVSEFRNIRLFPEYPETNIIASNARLFALSPNRSLIAIVNSVGSLAVMDTSEEHVMPRQMLERLPEQLYWSPDSAALLLIYADDTYEVVEVSASTRTRIRLPQLIGSLDIVWDERLSGNIFYLTEEAEVRSLSIADRQTKPLIQNVSVFSVHDRTIYVADTNNTLRLYTLQGQEIRRLNGALEKPVKKIRAASQDSIAIQFEDGSVSVMREGQNLIEVAPDVRTFSWSPDGQLLMVQTGGNELQVMNMENERLSFLPLETLHLVVRLSRTISHPQWFAGGHHIVYQADDEVVITEIDTRDYPVSYALHGANPDGAMAAVGRNGETMYYLRENGETAGVAVVDLLVKK